MVVTVRSLGLQGIAGYEVSVECALSCPAGRVYAVEKKEEALALLESGISAVYTDTLTPGNLTPQAE